MDCREAQQQILELLAETWSGASTPDVESHLAGCEICRSFSETQFMLDLKLRATISSPSLSPAFRINLMKKIRRESLSVWPEFLPDLAHLAGCACAASLCFILLPFSAGFIILTASAFTFVTYFVQSVMGGFLEMWEDEEDSSAKAR